MLNLGNETIGFRVIYRRTYPRDFSKLVCLSKLACLWTDKGKYFSWLHNMTIFVNYESVMFYATAPMANYGRNLLIKLEGLSLGSLSSIL